MTVETLTPLSEQVHYRQVIAPNYQKGSFVGNDTDNHDFKVAGKGKGRLTVAVHNATNKDLTVTVYGMHEADGDVGDVGTFELGGPGNGSFPVPESDDWGYDCLNDPFPWYLVRCKFDDTPDGETVTVYIDIQSA